eukprot:CAMPEP_0205918218 /NCGR_PEP_ID=MMETSP1325-20131115/9657_1 /ASSEMBLY_ACC=CAM_ASM_000708 /TAXON_ID=236786 /ORGANISM="Florenciella sp., Strain RCC1007" /LENGTH=265 /DNA_ID=CAMNT_0053285719 /DNA_START=54 /DNA_END=853 /DNA_ORIENTATION=+
MAEPAADPPAAEPSAAVANAPADAEASNEPEPSSPEEIAGRYKDMRMEIKNLAEKIGELEVEYNEHALVINTITPMEGDRKAFRLVGGVLVQNTCGEVLPRVKENQEMIKNTLQLLENQLRTKEKAANAWKTKYGIQTQQEREMMERAQQQQNESRVAGYQSLMAHGNGGGRGGQCAFRPPKRRRRNSAPFLCCFQLALKVYKIDGPPVIAGSAQGRRAHAHRTGSPDLPSFDMAFAGSHLHLEFALKPGTFEALRLDKRVNLLR